MLKFTWVSAAFFGLAVATGIVACSSHPPDQGPSASASGSGAEATGTVGYELRLGRTTHINKANYAITCPGGFTRSGTIDVSKLREIEGAIPNLPPGGPCALTVTATSTNGNVSCSGTKSGLTVTCPGNRPQDETHVKLTCTRNHQGREWGDNDWRENARTFVLGAEVNLVCAPQDAGADACVPKTSCPAGQTCGTVFDGCGGSLPCGSCPPGLTCVGGSCVSGCVPFTCANNPFPNANCGPIPDGCGGFLSCGTCTAPETCGGGGIANQCGGPDGCVPTTCAAYANSHGFTLACGALADGCGGTLNCGNCPAPRICTQNFCEGCLIVSCAQLGANCGTLSDGCGGTVNCGTCSSGQTCGGGGIPNQCGPATQDAGADGCAPMSSCPVAQNCGTAPDGCGGTLQCGACGSGQVCNIGACCTPQTPTCPVGPACGTLSDGCGGTIQCGSCPAGQSCGADGQCHTGCGGTNPSTLSCLQAQDKPTSSLPQKCSSCAQANGCFDLGQLGGTCEIVPGNANLFSGTLLDGQTCAQVVGASPISESAVCFQTLSGIFSSKCAASLQLTPCVCGSTDPVACLSGTATPTGPLYDEYACDFNSTSGPTINDIATNFTVQTFGAGMANSIVQCAVAFGCDCF